MHYDITGLLKCTTLRFVVRTDWAINKMPHHPMIRTSKRKIDLWSKALNLPLCLLQHEHKRLWIARTSKRERDLLPVKSGWGKALNLPLCLLHEHKWLWTVRTSKRERDVLPVKAGWGKALNLPHALYSSFVEAQECGRNFLRELHPLLSVEPQACVLTRESNQVYLVRSVFRHLQCFWELNSFLILKSN